MLKIKTYKYRLTPTKKQVLKLDQSLDVCRVLYNSCLADRKNVYERTGKGLTRIHQQTILKSDKKKIESLNGIHSQVLQNVLFRVDRAYQNFFRRVKAKAGKVGYPRFKGPGQYDSIHYPQTPGFQITPQGLKLSKIGTVKIKLHRSIVGKIKTCSVKREHNKWYACFSVEYMPDVRLVPDKAVGIDVGIKHFAVLSTDERIANPKYLRAAERTLKKKQQKLSRKKKGSTNREKARAVLAKLHLKVRNQRADFHHKISRKLVDTYGFIVAEDLNIQGLVKNHYLAKSISDAGWGQFLNFLAYKAEEAGCKFEKVAPHQTSINCCRCGERVPKALAERVHNCPFCKIVLDRDHNAAINILHKAGTASIYAWGEAVSQYPSSIQEASSVRAR
jgi:putative transposase